MAPKRHSATAAGRLAAVKKGAKRAKADEEHDGDHFFLDSDDDKGKNDGIMDTQDQADEEEARETAEEKRLRLAKEYLTQLRAHADELADDRRGVTGGSDEEEEGEDEEGRQRKGEDRLTALLKMDAAQAAGRVQRHLADHITLPTYEDASSSGTAKRGHRLAPTALALAQDDSAAWTVAKDGSICRWDIATGKRTTITRPNDAGVLTDNSRADWVKQASRATSKLSLLSAAVSSDGALLAVGGGDRKVHVFDARAGSFVQSFPGHRDAVTSLAFREGTHTLFSGSLDRTVKMWSIDDRAYMDTLFGHQAEVLSVDVGRAERALSCGSDRTCRVWKIPEESQLIFKHGSAGAGQSLECCRMITASEWVTGASDGSIQLWTQLKRKPLAILRGAHGPRVISSGGPHLAGATLCSSALSISDTPPDVTGWVQSVATARGSDLVASGAGDGAIRLWRVTSGKSGISGLDALGSLPARGWVNGLAVSRTGRLVVAAVGQEPRMGRWARDGAAHNGLLIHQLKVEGGV